MAGAFPSGHFYVIPVQPGSLVPAVTVLAGSNVRLCERKEMEAGEFPNTWDIVGAYYVFVA